MKYISLTISILLTAVVFSMSFASGSQSASLSLDVTNFILNMIEGVFPNHQIAVADLHIVIRKSAHIIEYMILGISWFITAKSFKISYVKLLVIGIMIASTDEIIQLISIDRGSSFIDVIVFDFIPFSIASYLCVLIDQRTGAYTVSENILSKLENKQITAEEAYQEMFKKKRKKLPFTRRAHFIKLKIRVPEEKGVNRLLAVLFFFPMPLLLVRFILSFVKMDQMSEDMPLTKSEMIDMISHKGIRVKVNAKSGERILIKTI